MNFEAIVGVFKTVGFPVGVAIWLLYRIDALMLSWLDSQLKIATLLQQLIDMHK